MITKRLTKADLFLRLVLLPLLGSALVISPINAQTDSDLSNETRVFDPFDPFDLGDNEQPSPEQDDSNKSAQELLSEGQMLLMSERPLDARTKLLRALQKDPNMYRAHYLLAGYYLAHVGHFRLAMKYIKRCEELFEQTHGAPPYNDEMLRDEHSSILYYQSQIRLSLDNYKGALDSLDRFAELGYTSAWYPGSRSWVLMKLGRLDEAISVARLGILAGAEPGRTLNMLGILLSMSDQRQEALEVFRKAIANEFSAGIDGQPATPLNNSGEVYKEMFEDEKAESSFLRATSLPDGCEHVLPSLNLTLIYIDQLKLDAAKKTLDSFERCVAQFPLRNNEEHVALVHLARGRIALHNGDIDQAIERFRSATEGTQWFGKIGTNQNDLMVASTISLSQALDRKSNALKLTVPESLSARFTNFKTRLTNSIEAWWKMRRARQILLDELNNIEDLTIRNTDSLIEYPTLGEVLSGLSSSSLANRLNKESEIDPRAPAKTFYQLYAAERELAGWGASRAAAKLDRIISSARPQYDTLLKAHASLLRLSTLSPDSQRYQELAYEVFEAAPALLRNYGFRLPVKINDDSPNSRALSRAIKAGPFHEITNSKLANQVCEIRAERADKNLKLTLSCPTQPDKTRSVEESEPAKAVNRLSQVVFTASAAR